MNYVLRPLSLILNPLCGTLHKII